MTSDLERIQKIINAVKKHDCLWNVNASDYGKRDKLEKAWKDVAQEVGKSGKLKYTIFFLIPISK